MAEKSSTFTRVSAGYERVVVPAVFAPWAEDLLNTAAVAPGTRMLGPACPDGLAFSMEAYVGSRSVADSDASHHRFAHPLTRLEKSVAAGVDP